MYMNTSREGAKRMEPGCFQWCLVTWPEPTGTHWNTGGSVWRLGKTLCHCESDQALAQVCQRVVKSPSLKVFKSHQGHGPAQLALGGPAWARGWTSGPPVVPANLNPFVKNVKINFLKILWHGVVAWTLA